MFLSLPHYRPRTGYSDDGSHINVNEMIDVSVFERWQADLTYRPANLVGWAQRKNVNRTQLQT